MVWGNIMSGKELKSLKGFLAYSKVIKERPQDLGAAVSSGDPIVFNYHGGNAE